MSGYIGKRVCGSFKSGEPSPERMIHVDYDAVGMPVNKTRLIYLFIDDFGDQIAPV